MTEFRLPSLGADMDAADVVEWHVQPGDRVKRGDIIVSVETDKGILDVEVFESGVVEEILVRNGRVTVGTVLARLRVDAVDTAGPATAPVSEQGQMAAPVATVALPTPTVPATSAAPPPSGSPSPRVHVSPAARRRAAERGIRIDSLQGSGPHGVVTLDDVESAAERAAPRPRTPDMRGAIAAAMSRSKREIPHYYLGTRIDLYRAQQWLSARNLERPVTARLVMAALLIRAVALALKQAPELNGWYLDGRFHPGSGIHVGVAVSLRQGGLVAPALHEADHPDLDTLMQRFLDLVGRARSGHLRASEMSDATITVTSLGERGVETLFPVIHPPQVAIVGFGSVGKRVVANDDDSIAVHPCIEATLSADHRVSDGHRGALFLAAVRERLQQPENL